MVIRAGVVGHPVGHSLSPRLHGRWLEKHGVDGSYEAIDCAPDAFVATIERLRRDGFAGCNVTLPFKAEALGVAQVTTPLARRLGTANMLTFVEGIIHADNTDSAGFAAAVRPYLTSAHRSALVLGAGGVAPAVLAALSGLGMEDVRIANRTRGKAEALAERFGARVTAWEERDRLGADLLVNATSLGLEGRPPLAFDLDVLPGRAVVMDTIYAPGGTPLTHEARERRFCALDGMSMLVHQAVPGFARWFGVTPDDLEPAEAALRAPA